MANVVSAIVTNQPARRQETGLFALYVDTVEASAVPQNDIYYVARVAPGVTVTSGSVQYDALGANTELTVGFYSDTSGTAVDADNLMTATATTSAGTTQFNGHASVSVTNSTASDYYIGILFSGSGAATGTIRIRANGTAEQMNES